MTFSHSIRLGQPIDNIQDESYVRVTVFHAYGLEWIIKDLTKDHFIWKTKKKANDSENFHFEIRLSGT